MDKQVVVDSHDEILLSNDRNKLSIPTTRWMNLKSMFNESQTIQKNEFIDMKFQRDKTNLG